MVKMYCMNNIEHSVSQYYMLQDYLIYSKGSASEAPTHSSINVYIIINFVNYELCKENSYMFLKACIHAKCSLFINSLI